MDIHTTYDQINDKQSKLIIFVYFNYFSFYSSKNFKFMDFDNIN